MNRKYSITDWPGIMYLPLQQQPEWKKQEAHDCWPVPPLFCCALLYAFMSIIVFDDFHPCVHTSNLLTSWMRANVQDANMNPIQSLVYSQISETLHLVNRHRT